MRQGETPSASPGDATPKRRWRRWVVLTVVGATAIGVYILLLLNLGPTVYKKPGLRFTAGSCGHSIEIPKIKGPGGIELPGTPEEGIRSQTWRADGTLLLEAVLIENCATPPKQGDYTIKGNTIYLSYRLAPQPVVNIDGKSVPMRAACNCPYRLTYEITGIPRADYRVDFPASGKGLP